MFYEHAIEALNDKRSTGWLYVSKVLNMSVEELRDHLNNKDLSFEQCILLTRNSSSLELLNYVLSFFDPNFGFRKAMHDQSSKNATISAPSMHMN